MINVNNFISLLEKRKKKEIIMSYRGRFDNTNPRPTTHDSKRQTKIELGDKHKELKFLNPPNSIQHSIGRKNMAWKERAAAERKAKEYEENYSEKALRLKANRIKIEQENPWTRVEKLSNERSLSQWMSERRYDFIFNEGDWVNDFIKWGNHVFLIEYIEALRDTHKNATSGGLPEFTNDNQKRPAICVIMNQPSLANQPYTSKLVDGLSIRKVYRRTRFDSPSITGSQKLLSQVLRDVLKVGFSRVFWQKDWEEMTEDQRNEIIVTQDEVNALMNVMVPVMIINQDPVTRELYNTFMTPSHQDCSMLDILMSEFLDTAKSSDDHEAFVMEE